MNKIVIYKYITKLKSVFLIILLFGFLSSCETESSLYFIFDRADGLSEDSKVLMNGKVIGKVKEININSDYRVLVECKMNNTIGIPGDSDIKIKSVDILGTKCIYIIPGISKEIENKNDTIVGTFEDRNLIDSIIIKGAEIMDEMLEEVRRSIDTLVQNEKTVNKNER